MTYKRQISYLDLIENGLKKGNAGFCKWEQRGGKHSLSVSISGVSGNLSEKARVYMEPDRLLGELEFRAGRAQAMFLLDDLGERELSGLGGIRIPLSQGRELSAEFTAMENDRYKNEERVNRDISEEMIVNPVEKEEPVDEVSGVYEKSMEMIYVEPVIEAEQKTVTELPIEGEREPADESQAVTEPKSLWESFADTHVTIRPFGTEAEYYRIALEDIYHLGEEYHMLRNNPFLLHGYYNYRYLILGKKDRRENEFWLGVPGIYHEREKMAARMYGFEKFEGTKPEYRVGDLGYYLISAM